MPRRKGIAVLEQQLRNAEDEANIEREMHIWDAEAETRRQDAETEMRIRDTEAARIIREAK